MREILVLEHVKKYFPIRRGFLNRKVAEIRAVDDVSFSVDRGETFGVVGESGSGKSTLAYVLQGIYKPTGGRILYNGEDATHAIKSNPKLWSKNVQIVFQNPGSSLNPARSVYHILEVPFHAFKIARSSSEFRERIIELIELVKLPADYIHKYPNALSGGEKQRVAIARALAISPALMILDEPTSALDPSVQAKILKLLLHLQEQRGLSILFISHEIAIARKISDRIAVMFQGIILEEGPTNEILSYPTNRHTKQLIASAPSLEEDRYRLISD